MKTSQLIVFDAERETLKPLTYTRPTAELRLGIHTLKEKWETYWGAMATHATVDYLSTKYPTTFGVQNILVNGSVVATPALCAYIREQLPPNVLLVKGGTAIALRTNKQQAQAFLIDKEAYPKRQEYPADIQQISHPWDLFQQTAAALKADFEALTKGKTSQPLSDSNRLIGDPNQLFIEEGAWIEGAMLNVQSGPIYVDKNATIMEGSLVRGGLYLGEGSTLKMGCKIYGATSVGPQCKIGGEVGNSVILGYSNKGHEGYIGNAVLGEWCNLGADTNSSNLKNNYDTIKVWNYAHHRFLDSGQQFCGLIMGDHSKSGINTMFNTGTVVGVSCNIFGGDFVRTFIPSFSWGSSKGFATYKLKKAFETAERVMMRRKKELNATEQAILEHVFSESSVHRKY
ncbi:MAG: GlmU family protein [Aureispira sp.]